MPPNDFLHPIDAGRVVRASFRVDADERGLSLYFASRGGTRGTRGERNPEYADGLRVLLERLARANATISDAVLDLPRVKDRPLAERRLPLTAAFALPIDLPGVDTGRLRRALQAAQGGVLRTEGLHAQGGNPTRAIRLFVGLPDSFPAGRAALAEYLVHGMTDSTDATDDPEVLLRRAQAFRTSRSAAPPGNPTPTTVEAPASRRFLRLPGVVAHVLNRARGRCELCMFVPFLRDDGEPFLEVHHLKQLAAFGSDMVTNAAALCANCHRELHHGAERHSRLSTLYAQVPELVRE